MSDIAERVKKIIVDKLGVDESEVTSEMSQMIVAEQAENIQTVGHAVEYLESQVSA